MLQGSIMLSPHISQHQVLLIIAAEVTSSETHIHTILPIGQNCRKQGGEKSSWTWTSWQRCADQEYKNMDTHKTKNKAVPCTEIWKHSWSCSSRVRCMRTLLRGGLGALVSHASLLSDSHWLREYIRLKKTSGIVSPQDFSSQTSGCRTCLPMKSSRI